MWKFWILWFWLIIPGVHANVAHITVDHGVLIQIVSVPQSEQLPGYQPNQRIVYFLHKFCEIASFNSANIDADPLLNSNTLYLNHLQKASNFAEVTAAISNSRILLEKLLLCKIDVLDVDFGLVQFHFADSGKRNLFSEGIELLFNENWRLKVQYGSDVSRRNRVPNDPEFNQQKYLQTIQMPDAWDYGTSSITRAGDSAVIALIDDGVDTGHVDLIPNLFRNNREIPWNGVDEDSNGYIDDYWGWNGGDNSPLIFNRESIRYGHATSVASVMMAAGNNGKGIAGILWDTKLMVLHCYPTGTGSADVGVVNCMVYLFKQKKLYLESKGKKGTNIVAVNMSVGIDRAFPFEFPIWCSMYDSLASVGILCASSTTNLDIDVDDPNEGDIPSLCPSNGLIVVSSADENKLRLTSGYGSKSVDIHTAGQNMYLAKPNQTHSYPYAVESGTSFAAPQVTATIAWLYSRSCNVYLELWKSNPDSAIRLMRNWILTSAEVNSSLVGKTTSGGYLQVLSAWNKMHQWCSANDNAYSTKTTQPKSLVLYPNPIASDKMVLVGIRINNPNVQTMMGMKARLCNAAGNLVSVLNVESYHLGEDAGLVVKSETVLAPGYYQITLFNPQTQENHYLPIIITDN